MPLRLDLIHSATRSGGVESLAALLEEDRAEENGDDVNGDDVDNDDVEGYDVKGDDVNDDDVNGNDVNGDDVNGEDVNGEDVNGDGVNAPLDWLTAMTGALISSPDDVIPMTLLRRRRRRRHFDVNAEDRHRRTALHVAARLGRDVIVRQLIRAGAHVDARDIRGATPLSLAATSNGHRAAQVLIDHGADVNVQTLYRQETPLHCACAMGAEETVAVLLNDSGCDVTRTNATGLTALSEALPSAYGAQVLRLPLSRSLSICRQLFRTGCDFTSGGAQCCLLHERVVQDDLVGACLLLRHFPSLNVATDDKGSTALELAVRRHGYEMALILLHHGASPTRLIPPPPPASGISLSRLFHQATSKNPGGENQTGLHPPPPPSRPPPPRAPGDDGTARDFHKLRFLQALLGASFLSRYNVDRLVRHNLLTPDLLGAVLSRLAKEDAEEEEEEEEEVGEKEEGRKKNVRREITDANGEAKKRGKALLGRASSAVRSDVAACSSSSSNISNSRNISNSSSGSRNSNISNNRSNSNSSNSSNSRSNSNSSSNSRSSSSRSSSSRSRSSSSNQGGCNSYEAEAVHSVCVALRRSPSLQHQCRLAVRRLLGTSLPLSLPFLGLPQRVQNFISLGPDMARSGSLDGAELHIAVTENDVSKVRQLLQRGVGANLPFLERTPLTRALELLPSHNDVTDYDVTTEENDVIEEEEDSNENRYSDDTRRHNDDVTDIYVTMDENDVIEDEDSNENHSENTLRRFNVSARRERVECTLCGCWGLRGDVVVASRGEMAAKSMSASESHSPQDEKGARAASGPIRLSYTSTSTNASPLTTTSSSSSSTSSNSSLNSTTTQIFSTSSNSTPSFSSSTSSSSSSSSSASQRTDSAATAAVAASASDANNDASDVIALLLRHGASLTQADPLGDTPLHVAVGRGSCVVRRLLGAAAASAVASGATVTSPPACSAAVASAAEMRSFTISSAAVMLSPACSTAVASAAVTSPPACSTAVASAAVTSPPACSTAVASAAVTSPPTCSTTVPSAAVTSPPTCSTTVPSAAVTSPPTCSTAVASAAVTSPPTCSTAVASAAVTSPPTCSTAVASAAVTSPPTCSTAVASAAVTSPPTCSTAIASAAVTSPPTCSTAIVSAAVTSPPTCSTAVASAAVTSPPTCSTAIASAAVTSPPTCSTAIVSAAVTSPPTCSTAVASAAVTSPPTCSTAVASAAVTSPPARSIASVASVAVTPPDCVAVTPSPAGRLMMDRLKMDRLKGDRLKVDRLKTDRLKADRLMMDRLDPTRSRDRLDLTPLELALLRGDLHTVRLLLSVFRPLLTRSQTPAANSVRPEAPIILNKDTRPQTATNSLSSGSPISFDKDTTCPQTTHVMDSEPRVIFDRDSRPQTAANSVSSGSPISFDKDTCPQTTHVTDSEPRVIFDKGSRPQTAAENSVFSEASAVASSSSSSSSAAAQAASRLQTLASWVGGGTGVTALHCAAAAGLYHLARALQQQHGVEEGGTSLDEVLDALGHSAADAAVCRGEVYRQRASEYCPRWYDQSWTGALRVWPKTRPRVLAHRRLVWRSARLS